MICFDHHIIWTIVQCFTTNVSNKSVTLKLCFRFKIGSIEFFENGFQLFREKIWASLSYMIDAVAP